MRREPGSAILSTPKRYLTWTKEILIATRIVLEFPEFSTLLRSSFLSQFFFCLPFRSSLFRAKAAGLPEKYQPGKLTRGNFEFGQSHGSPSFSARREDLVLYFTIALPWDFAGASWIYRRWSGCTWRPIAGSRYRPNGTDDGNELRNSPPTLFSTPRRITYRIVYSRVSLPFSLRIIPCENRPVTSATRRRESICTRTGKEQPNLRCTALPLVYLISRTNYSVIRNHGPSEDVGAVQPG